MTIVGRVTANGLDMTVDDGGWVGEPVEVATVLQQLYGPSRYGPQHGEMVTRMTTEGAAFLKRGGLSVTANLIGEVPKLPEGAVY